MVGGGGVHYATSINGKSLIIEEPPLQGVLHLHPVHHAIFGLQGQLLQGHIS